MDRVEVVCVTMGQKDLTIADKMHITGDAVFGNQADGCRKETQSDDGRTLRMITTDTRGVGVNRNIALLHATGDILLFADDDICYADGYADGVRRAYAQHPDADMILFSLDITQGGRVIRRIKNRDGRLHFHRALRYGTCVCSIRRDSQRRANIWFSTLFGGGTNYAHGEDTLFCATRFAGGYGCIRAASASVPAPRTRPPAFTALMRSIFTIRAFCIGRHSARLQRRCACAFA